MSILETIRRKASILIVVLIGGALLVFVLEDAIQSGRFFFGGEEDVVAKAGSQKLKFNELNNRVEYVSDVQKLVRHSTSLETDVQNQIQQSVFAEMVSDMVMGPQYKKLGISVTEDEMDDLMLGEHLAPDVIKHYLTNPKTGRIYDELIDPKTGGLIRSKWVEYVKNMSNPQNKEAEEQTADYQLTEEEVKVNQLQQKYYSLIRYSLFYTDDQAKQEVTDENRHYNISYILKRYNSIADNAVNLTDNDIQNYYNRHKYEYIQPEETRKIDYVAFLANPTDKDMTDLQNEVDSITHTFKTLKANEDSAYIVAETDDRNVPYDPNYHKAGTLNQLVDSVMSHAEKGFVYGPYRDMNKFKIAKLLDIAYLPDSAKASHILIRPNDPSKEEDWAEAKKRADSIKNIVTKENFAEMAAKFSADQGSAPKGGDIGWFTQVADMVPEFIHACFFNDEGDIVEVRSQFGYHIIYITGQNEKSKCLHVGYITKNIGPSPETLNKVFSQASTFAGQCPTGEIFETKAGNMNKRIADLKENDEQVPGLTTPKEIIRWAFNAKTGDISQVIDAGGNRFIVAHLMQVAPKGTNSLEIVKDQVKEKALQEKKAEKIIEGMNASMQGTSTLAALGQKMNETPATQQGLTFQMYAIPGLGKEDELLGTMTALKPKTLSQPIEGNTGVFVIVVDSVYTGGAADYKLVQQQQQQALQYNLQGNELYNAIEKEAGFVNHYGKFY